MSKIIEKLTTARKVLNGITYARVDTSLPYNVVDGVHGFLNLEGTRFIPYAGCAVGNPYNDNDDDVWRPIEQLSTENNYIDAKHFEVALDLLVFIKTQCNTLALDDEHDRATLACKLVNYLEGKELI